MKKFYPFFAVVVGFVFAGCFSPWKSKEATMILVLNGGSNVGRAAAFPPDDGILSRCEHTVALAGISENITLHAQGGSTIEAIVNTGVWDIAVETFLDGKLYATGSVSVDLQPGRDNYIPLIMYKAFDEEISSGIEFDGIGSETIDLAGGGDAVFRGETLAVTINGEYDSYQWYLDGNLMSELTGNTIALYIDSDYTIGFHSLMAVVIKDGIPHSKELLFMVKYKE